MKSKTAHAFLLATLALTVSVACGGDPAPATCGVTGATQACVCTNGTQSSQTCQADGAWGACACPSNDPRCAGVQCDNGGQCVIEDDVPVCDCPPGITGSLCLGVCTNKALQLGACTASAHPGQWYAEVDGEVGCFAVQSFSFFAPDANEVTLAVVRRDNQTPPPIGELHAMGDDDDDGTWEATLLLPSDTEWIYAYIIAGELFLDPKAPTAPEIEASVVTTLACADTGEEAGACTRLLGEGGIGLSCARPNTPGCGAPKPGCPDGCIEDAWFGVVLPVVRVVTELRFRADWWRKRPATWELWVASSPGHVPGGAGARLVASGRGEEAPWQCVTGESCDDAAVPAECCPDGRDRPQRVAEGALIAKWDRHTVPETVGQYFFLRVTSTDTAGELILEGLALEGHDCLDAGARLPLPDCTMGGAGVAAGCLENEWCAPGQGDVLGEPGCVTIGTARRAEPCATQRCSELGPDACVPSLLCEAGLACFEEVPGGRRTCAETCDTRDAAGGTCPERFECVVPTVDGATLPHGACLPPACPAYFASGVCPEGWWCSPEYVRCLPAGARRAGETCGDDAQCEEGTVCADGRCSRICGDPGRFPGAATCPNEEACLELPSAGGLGLCARPCTVGAEPACRDGYYCQSSEFNRFGLDFCTSTPESWPSDEGFAPNEVCPLTLFGDLCAPLGACTSRGEQTLCVPLCRSRLGSNPWEEHPDCPEETPFCVVGNDGFGLCLP